MKYRKTIITILTALVVFFGIVMLKNCCSCLIPNHVMGVRSIIAQKQVDTLFLGSSAYRKGLDMYMLEEELDGESYALTYNGNQPLNMALELKEILNAGTKIKYLIVDFNPSMMDRGADLSDKRLLWDISMEGKLSLWKELAKKEDTDFFTFYDYFVLSNNDYMITYPFSYPLIAKRYYRGGSTQADEASGSTQEELEALEVVEDPGIDELQLQSVGEIITRCMENDIRLIFMESPRYQTMADNQNYADKSAALKAYLEEQDVETVLTADLGFDNTNPAYYSDLTHMSGEGKREFTALVAEYLKQREK
ncbi:MAG TPA: hypothetical protein PLU43_01155 [Lachnospiraceae bacterium]|nr:hypothetical protein [Lachnospiraceae bacterium]